MTDDELHATAEAGPAASCRGVADLRRLTASRHAALESTALARSLLSATLDLPTYARILTAWAAAWGPMERAVLQSPAAPSLSALLPQPRHALALADLRQLAAAGCPVDPPQDAVRNAGHPGPDPLAVAGATAAGLLGLCYVMGGASLGSRVIARHLQDTLGLDAGHGAAFFATHHTGAAAWPAWVAAADQQLSQGSAAAGQQTLQGACTAFDSLLQAFRSFEHGDAPDRALPRRAIP